MKRAFNASLFSNKNDKVTFSKSKDEKVKADYNGDGSEKDGADKIQLLGIKAVSKAGGSFIRLTFVDRTSEGSTKFYNGALFPNEKKEAGSSQPDFTGSVDLDKEGNERLRLAGWVKLTKNQDKYLSVAVSEYQVKDEKAAENVAQAQPAPAMAGGDDDFPF